MTFPPVARDPNETVVAVLGLGEAGGAIAADLIRAGATVRAYDPAVDAPPGSIPCTGEADAATGADIVLSVNSAVAATGALRAGLAAKPRLWADLNTAAPKLKRELAEMCADNDVAFADVALMSPVPGKGLATPALVSGTGSGQYAEKMNVLGGRATALDGPAGLAATRKLLRSVFYKGLAAAALEALEAARAAGHEEWLRQNIVDELVASDERTLERLETGTVRHALRRSHEMAAATELLEELGVPPRIAAASRDWLVALTELTELTDAH
jgi:3-hydroxyisobutyrate dehydrogenase-like beta-hydroxyacid dehydrogenase